MKKDEKEISKLLWQYYPRYLKSKSFLYISYNEVCQWSKNKVPKTENAKVESQQRTFGSHADWTEIGKIRLKRLCADAVWMLADEECYHDYF